MEMKINKSNKYDEKIIEWPERFRNDQKKVFESTCLTSKLPSINCGYFVTQINKAEKKMS